MPEDILKMTEEYLSDDPTRWGKLAGNVHFRRLEILLLSEILAELRKLNSSASAFAEHVGQDE